MLAILMAASLAVAPEVEVLGGFIGGGDADPAAFAFALRVGAGLNDILTLSGLLVGVPGREGYNLGGGLRGDPSGLQAWAALMEIRAHTPGPVQVHLGTALGVGKLISWQCNCSESQPLHGHVAPAFRMSLGLRYLPANWHGFNFGAEFGATHWSGLEDAPPSFGFLQITASPKRMWTVLAAVGYRWP